MREERQMSKNTRQTEGMLNTSPYINRCAASQPISMKNIKLHKNEMFDFTLKTSKSKKKSKISKIFFENCIQKRACGFLLV